ncbi:MAG TPA: DUF3090 family protein [Acidimicrobiales bacterium]|jgi:uncharacterized repeat protein (TIGR03847 family)|nr:DUF3090 family protein [Acidimicrobiales bacterium]
MSEGYDLSSDRLVVGTVGPVGNRLFLLQCRQGPMLLTFKIEKQQVAVVADLLARIVRGERRPGHLPDELPLEEPAEPVWAVGTIGVSYDEAGERIVLVIEELVAEEETGAIARLSITREQAAAFAIQATKLVESGRPPCPLCGSPLDPSGHECPRTNGHRPPAV